MRTPLSLVFAAALALIVAGCGFHLRGNMKNGGSLPYKTLHIALPDNSDVGLTLGRFVDSMGTTELVATPGEAEAVFQQLYDNREKSILSVNAQGLVREYQLRQRYGFRVVDSKGKVLVPPQEISLQRDISYDDSAVLSQGLRRSPALARFADGSESCRSWRRQSPPSSRRSPTRTTTRVMLLKGEQLARPPGAGAKAPLRTPWRRPAPGPGGCRRPSGAAARRQGYSERKF